MSSLDSAIRILQCLSTETPFLKVSQIAERLALPKSTVSRLMKTLNDGGLLCPDGRSRGYRAGPLALRLGTIYLSHHDLLGQVDDALAQLVEKYGFTGYAGALDGSDVVTLRQRQGRYPLRYLLDVGGRLPAVTTAIGLALLARDEDAAIRRLVAPLPDVPTDELPSMAQVMHAVGRCRRDHVIEVRCASVPGITAIGAAVGVRSEIDDGRDPSIGFSLSFPEAATDAEMRARMSADLAAVAVAVGGRVSAAGSS
jgi:DNA-binding IclR family transcriptional regulator